MENTYNGWSNRDTWIVNLWIDNNFENYTYIQHLIKGIGVKYKLEELSEKDFKARLKKLYYGADTKEINWNNVNVKEIKDVLLEDAKIEKENKEN